MNTPVNWKTPLAALALVATAAAVTACVKLGESDPSVILPDPSLNYPDFIQHDESVVTLAAPDGYTNVGVRPTFSGEPGEPTPTLEPEQPYVLRRYRLGPPDYAEVGSVKGGMTFVIEGTGNPVCIAVDPEALPGDECLHDDGDVDVFVGLEEHYQGTPGEEIGFFSSSWTDDLGVEHETDTNICLLTVEPTEPVGRGTVESCAFNTVPGQRYMVALRAFTYPVDDYVLNVGVLVQPGHKGLPICVFSAPRYLVSSGEAIDESDSAYPDNPYAENRDPCLCPKDDTERNECGIIE